MRSKNIPKRSNNFITFFKVDTALKISKVFIVPFSIIASILLLSSLYLSLFVSSTDTVQGEHYRILFIHVPSAWFSMLIYTLMTVLSIGYLISKHPLLIHISIILSYLGSLFTLITLITGSMWGLPMWGTWWVWDARLTSVLITLFIYLGYNILYKSFKETYKGGYFSSIFCIIGFVNIPIIKYSVNYWSTLHQPTTIVKMGNTIDISMLYPLLTMATGLLFFCISTLLVLLRIKIINNKIDFIESNIS